MKIEELYKAYLETYRRHQQLVNREQASAEKKRDLEQQKTMLEKELRSRKIVRWKGLQKRKESIQNQLDLLNVFEPKWEEEITPEVEELVREFSVSSWWDELDKEQVWKYIEDDSLNTKMQLLLLEEENFEVNFEKWVEKSLADINWQLNYIDTNEKGIVETEQEARDILRKIREEVQSIKLEDAKGKLSDHIYLLAEKNEDGIPSICEIKHDKHPIIFLYKQGAISTEEFIDESYNFVDYVIQQILTNNCIKLFDLYINIVGMFFSERQMERRIKERTPIKNVFFKNDLGELSTIINDRIDECLDKFAGKKSIDEYNERIFSENGIYSDDYAKYSIAQFIVPQVIEDDDRKYQNEDLMGAVLDGSKYGFIPIFYVPDIEWENEDTENHFIRYLKKKIQKTDYVVCSLDLKTWEVEKYENSEQSGLGDDCEMYLENEGLDEDYEIYLEDDDMVEP